MPDLQALEKTEDYVLRPLHEYRSGLAAEGRSHGARGRLLKAMLSAAERMFRYLVEQKIDSSSTSES